MLELRRQFATLLQDTHLLPAQGGHSSAQQQGGGARGRGGASRWCCWADDPAHACNRFASRPEVLQAALVAALSPQVAVGLSSIAAAHSKPGWLDSRGGAVFLHPSSVVAALTAAQLHHQHVVFLEKSKTSRVFLREVTVVSPLALMLAGSSLCVQHEAGSVLVDGWLQLRVPAVSAVLIKRLRQLLDGVLAGAVKSSAGGGGGGGRQRGGGGGGSRGSLAGPHSLAVTAVVQQLLAAYA
jgi:ATP-dependent RNA helicase DHX29